MHLYKIAMAKSSELANMKWNKILQEKTQEDRRLKGANGFLSCRVFMTPSDCFKMVCSSSYYYTTQ